MAVVKRNDGERGEPGKRRKRPFYLLLALLGALAMGTAGAFEGWGTFVRYHATLDTSDVGSGVSDEADRVALVARVQAYLQTFDAAKSRAWPLGVASLLLGTAMFVCAVRAIGGSRGARVALVQLVIAQGATNVAAFLLLKDVAEADLRISEAEDAARWRDRVPDRDRVAVLHAAAKMRRAQYPVAIALDTLSSMLIVIGLTTRRSRAFFDASAEALREP